MMMPEEVLGTPYHGPALQRFMAELGGVEACVDELDGEVYVDVPSAGISLSARPGEPVLDTVRMYAEGGEEGFSAYRGMLPEGLEMSMLRPAINTHMSRAPDFTGPEHDSWDLAQFRLVVVYRGDSVRYVAITTRR